MNGALWEVTFTPRYDTDREEHNLQSFMVVARTAIFARALARMELRNKIVRTKHVLASMDYWVVDEVESIMTEASANEMGAIGFQCGAPFDKPPYGHDALNAWWIGGWYEAKRASTIEDAIKLDETSTTDEP